MLNKSGNKSMYRRSFLGSIITGILLISFVVAPLSTLVQFARAQDDYLTSKWTITNLGSGLWEGGVVIGDIMPGIPGEEVVFATNSNGGTVYALDGRDGSILWTYRDNSIHSYAQTHLYDIDNDGDLEVLVPLYYLPGLLVLRGDGTRYWRTVIADSGTVMSAPAAADVDGDGKLEIFLGSQNVEVGSDEIFEGRITKLSYDGEILAQNFMWRSCSGGVSIGDTDNDGEFEVYVGDRDIYTTGRNDGAYGKGVKSFWASNLTERWYHPDILTSSQCPVLADVNGDGILEVIVSDMGGGLVVLNSTSGSAIRKSRRINVPGHYQVTVYDIDRDGHLEVLTADGTHHSRRGDWSDQEIVIFDLVDWTVDARLTVGNCKFSPTLADVTGDGEMDIIAVTTYNYTIFVFSYDEATDTYLQVEEEYVPLSYGLMYAIVQDIDNDGLVEVVVPRSSGSNARIYTFETDAPKPAERVRSEVKWYSEYRRGAAEYVLPPGSGMTSPPGGSGMTLATAPATPETKENTITSLIANPGSDPEFGKTDQGGSQTNLCGYSYGSRYQIPEVGTAQSVSIRVYERDSEDRAVKVAIYDDDAGAPNNLLASGSGTIPAGTDDWVTINLDTPSSLTAGAYYWLVANAKESGKTLRFYYSAGETNQAIYDTTDLADFPQDPCEYSDFRDRAYSIYCSYLTEILPNVHLTSEEDTASTSDEGSITFDAVSYSLPNDVSKGAGTYSAEYFPSLGYEFDHWEVAGTVSVSLATDNPVDVTVSGDGTLTAIYSETPYPTVVDHDPVADATGVPVGTTVEVTFSKAMNHAATELAFSTVPSVTGSFGWSVGDTVMTFDPTSDLAEGTLYTVTITTAAMAQDGYFMESDYSWSFTTKTAGALETFGKTDQGGSQTNLCGYSYGSRYQIPEVGTAQSVSIRVYERDSEDRAVKVAIYDDDGGVPNNLLASGSGTIPAGTDDWVTINLDTPSSLTAGAYYWLVANAKESGKTLRFYYSAGETNQAIYDTTDLADFPQDPCEYSDFRDRAYSIYCSYLTVGPTNQLPEVSDPSPIDSAIDVPVSPAWLNFTLTDADGDLMDYYVFLDDGEVESGLGVVDGRFNVSMPDWSYSTPYTWRVNVTDHMDGWVVATYTFTTKPFTPPSVVSHVPVPDATDVSITTTIQVTFSEAMDQAVTEGAFSLDSVAGSFSWSGGDTVMTFTPDSSLDYDTLHTVTITTAAKDQEGEYMEALYSWSFTTEEEPPPTPPYVDSHVPVADATDVSVTTTIQVTFSEAMDHTPTEGAFSIAPSVAGSFSWSGGDTVMTFTPDSSLDYDTLHTVTITTAAKDQEGEYMEALYSWSFTTEEMPGNPYVVGHVPGVDEIDVSIATTVEVTFSSPMDHSSTEGAFSLDSVTGSFGWSGGDTVMTFTPDSDLLYDMVYTVTITTDAMDEIDQYMLAPYSWSFTTEAYSGVDALLVSSEGTNTSLEDLICYAGGSSTNIFNWYVDGDSLTNLLLLFDDGTAEDYSPYGNDGIVNGATWTSSGVVGGAYYFDGGFDFIKVLDGDIGDIHQPGSRENMGYFNGYPFPGTLGGDGTWSEITVELWIYLSEDQNDVRFVTKLPSFEIGLYETGDANRLFARVWTQNGADHTELGYLGYGSTRYNTPLSNNTWYHVAFTYKDGMGLTLYLNGEIVGFTSWPAGNIHCSSGEPLYIGWFDYFHGMIDEVRLYPRSLSEQQIYQRYLETKDGSTSKSIMSSQETVGLEVWQCEVIQDGTSKFSNTLLVLNTPPSAENVKIGPREELDPLVSDALIASYDYYDYDGHSESDPQIRWYKNGDPQASYNDYEILPSSATSAGETWSLTVTPSDGSDFGEPVTSPTVTIAIANSPPDIVGVPSLAEVGGNLICTPTTVDPDSDPRNIYNWYVDGDPITNLQMPFDTDNMFTTRDYSIYGNDGTVSGATWTSDGLVGGAYIFDGDDVITVDDHTSLGGDGTWSEISIEFWIKVAAPLHGTRIIAKKVASASTGTYMVGFRTSDDDPANTLVFGVTVPMLTEWGIEYPTYMEVYNADTGDPLNTVLEVDNWYHVVCTYKEGLGLTIYINGTERVNLPLEGVLCATEELDDEPLFIGYDGGGAADRYLNGTLDEVRIYNRALTPEQVQQCYLESKDGLSSSSTIVSTETNPGEVWMCMVIPNDRYQDGVPADSNELTV